MLDDANRFGEQNSLHKIFEILDKSKIKYFNKNYMGEKWTATITSEDLRFFASM